MQNKERMSLSITKERATKIRELVKSGAYPSLSAAADDAFDILLEQQAEKAAWWAETVRRCEEAEKHPERLLSAEAFTQELNAEIEKRKMRIGVK